MFGQKISIEPISNNEEVLIQVSEPIEVSKKIRITVPTQYMPSAASISSDLDISAEIESEKNRLI